MKHLEDTIHQYHLQSEKNLEGNNCGFKNTRSVVFTIEFSSCSKFNVIPQVIRVFFFTGCSSTTEG